MGTGTGFLALLLAELGHRVTGVDLAAGMLGLRPGEGAARVPPGVPAAASSGPGDAVDPPLPAGSVDAVVSRHLLWTLTDPARAFASWHRLLRPGGRVVAIDGLWRLRAPGLRAAAGGTPAEPPAYEAKARQRAAWDRHYSDAVQASLPLFASGRSIRCWPPCAPPAWARRGSPRCPALSASRPSAARAAPPTRRPRMPRYVISATLEAAGAPLRRGRAGQGGHRRRAAPGWPDARGTGGQAGDDLQLLHDLPAGHHRHPLGQRLDDGEVVGDATF